MNSRILLISIMLNPQYSNSGIDHLAGFLRWKGYSVDIAYFHNNNSLDDIKLQIKYDYDFFGFYVDIKNIDKCYIMANFIKERTTANIWFGGAFVSSCYREILIDCIGVDYVILGSGEEPILYLLTHIGSTDLDTHPNIASRTSLDEKSFFENKRFDYPVAEDYYKKNPALRGFYTHCLQTKNNTCTGACSFCINWCLKRKRMDLHYRPTTSIVDEMLHIHKQYHINHFFLTDDDLVDPCNEAGKNRIRDLCKAIIESGLKVTLGCYLKANSLLECEEDELLLEMMYKAGFVFAFVGIESGCQGDLTLFHKMATVDDNRRSLKLLYKHNIKPEYEMIVFHPYSTLDSIRESFLFLKEFQSFNLRHYSISGVSIYKNTILWQKTYRDGLLDREYSYKNPDAYNYVDSDVKQVAKFLQTRFGENPEISDLVTADQLVTYYYRFSRHSQSVREMSEAVLKVKQENHELLHYYFAPLYLNNDLGACERKYATFINELKFQEEIIQNLINKMIKLNIMDQQS